MLWVIIPIFIGVFGFMFYSIYAHRKSVGHKAAQFHENTVVEILWTAIPAVILVVIAWPTTKVVVAQKDTSNPDLTIKVTGYQWKWGYDYLQEGFNFYSTLSTPFAQIEGKEPNDAQAGVVKGLKMTFTKEKIVTEMPDGTKRESAYKLDPTKTPKAIDIEVASGEHKGVVYLGIYELDGDTLRICFAMPDRPVRPTEFSAGKGSVRALSEFKREKK